MQSSSLILYTTSTQSDSAASSTKTAPAVADASTSLVNGKASVTITSKVSIPTNLASQIVPASSVDQTVPEYSTLASILLGSSMPWNLVIENSDASGQLLAYVPELIAAALNISISEVQIQSLLAYEPESFNGNNTDVLQTVVLFYIPSADVDELQDQISTPTSPLYNQPAGIPQQLASLIVPSFAVDAYSSKATASNQTSTAAQASSGDNKSKTIIIAVVVSFGVVILALAGYGAYRATKSGAISLSPQGRHARLAGEGPRQLQLGGPGGGVFVIGGGGGNRDSSSTTSSASTESNGYSGSSRPGQATTHASGTRGHGTSTSVDVGSDRRSSWWRFSGQSAEWSGSAGQHSGGPASGDMREQHRRVSVLRGPNGQINSGAIGRCVRLSFCFGGAGSSGCEFADAPARRPQIQSNSLMLD